MLEGQTVSRDRRLSRHRSRDRARTRQAGRDRDRYGDDARRAPEAISTALSQAGCRGRGVVLNVTDMAGIDTAIADIEAHEGAATILVNNAGITRDGLLLRMKPDDWQAIMDTNLSFRYSGFPRPACARMMKQRRGRIISIASVVGLIGNAGQANLRKPPRLASSASANRWHARSGSRGITVGVVAPRIHRHRHDTEAE